MSGFGGNEDDVHPRRFGVRAPVCAQCVCVIKRLRKHEQI